MGHSAMTKPLTVHEMEDMVPDNTYLSSRKKTNSVFQHRPSLGDVRIDSWGSTHVWCTKSWGNLWERDMLPR